MPKSWLIYIETLSVALVVSVGLHYLTHLDWPWSLFAGLLAAIVGRPAVHGPLARH